MTTIVMGQDDEGVTRTPSVIVLALNASQAQKYLSPDNAVLQHLLGARIIRAEVNWTRWDHLETFLTEHRSKDDQEHFADRYGDMSWNDIKKRMRDKNWLAEQFGEGVLDHIGTLVTGSNDELREQVRIVFFDGVELDTIVLRLAVTRFFPNAQYFAINKTQHSLPVRAWEVPLCRTCFTQMRESGTYAFACEGCGNVAIKNM